MDCSSADEDRVIRATCKSKSVHRVCFIVSLHLCGTLILRHYHRAAAIAASCRAEINLEVAYYDLRQNEVLGEYRLYLSNLLVILTLILFLLPWKAQEFLRTVQNHYGMRVGSGSDNDISASTDFVSWSLGLGLLADPLILFFPVP